YHPPAHFLEKVKGWQRLIIEGTRCVLEKGIGLVPCRHDGRDLQQDSPLAWVIANCSPPHRQIPGVVGGVLRRLKSLNQMALSQAKKCLRQTATASRSGQERQAPALGRLNHGGTPSRALQGVRVPAGRSK